MEIENPQVLGTGGYKDSLIESTPIAKCKNCKEVLYKEDDYIKTVTNHYLCDIICLKEHLTKDGFIIEG